MQTEKVYTERRPVDAELLFFVQNEINDGFEHKVIFDRLIAVGWKAYDVNEAFAAHGAGVVAELPRLKIWSRKILKGLWLLLIVAIVTWLVASYIEDRNNPHGGNDASIKQSLGNMRSQAEIIYNHNAGYSYLAVCGSAEVIQNDTAKRLIEATKDNVPKSFLGKGESGVVCNSNQETYAVSSRLSAHIPRYWCIDWTGYAGLVTRNLYEGETHCSVDIQVPRK